MRPLPDAVKNLVGKTIEGVHRTDSDEGLVLTLSDGSTLEVWWSGGEGAAEINGDEVEVQGTFFAR